MSGAMAMIGIVWLATMSGTSARSSTRTWTSTIARRSPKVEPSANPIAALRSVNSAAREQTLDGRGAGRVRASELGDDVPDVRQLDVRREGERQRRIVVDRDPGPQERVVPPRVAADELGGLPDDRRTTRTVRKPDGRGPQARAGAIEAVRRHRRRPSDAG